MTAENIRMRPIFLSMDDGDGDEGGGDDYGGDGVDGVDCRDDGIVVTTIGRVATTKMIVTGKKALIVFCPTRRR